MGSRLTLSSTWRPDNDNRQRCFPSCPLLQTQRMRSASCSCTPTSPCRMMYERGSTLKSYFHIDLLKWQSVAVICNCGYDFGGYLVCELIVVQ